MASETQTRLDDTALPGPKRFAAKPTPIPGLRHELRLVFPLGTTLSDAGDGLLWGGIGEGGTWTSRWGSGKVLAQGQDILRFHKGLGMTQDVNLVVVTDEPEEDKRATIHLRGHGWRVPGDPEKKEAIFIGPSEEGEYMRAAWSLRSGDERFKHLNNAVFVSAGIGHWEDPDFIVYLDYYRVL